MSENQEYVPSVFEEDPLQLKDFVGKRVRVTTVHNEMREGEVYTIDPITESIILSNCENGKPSMDVIMRHIVKAVDIIDSKCDSNNVLDQIFCSTPIHSSDEFNRKKKDVLMKWFNEKGVPYIEQGDILIVHGILEIYPPYESEQCVSNNTVVLTRVRNIVSSMPVE